MTARPHLFALAAIVVAGLLAAFGVRSAVVLDLVFTLLLYAVLGQSWNWISGYAGNISFGHAIFFGCGAYASALCVTHGLSPWLAIPRGALAAALLALVDGLSDARAARTLFLDRDDRRRGAGRSVRAHLAGARERRTGSSCRSRRAGRRCSFRRRGRTSCWRSRCSRSCSLRRSRWNARGSGYYLRALRANHAAAASVGIDERRYKLIAFAWSATMAAAAGVLYAQYTLFVDPPSTIALAVSIDIALIGVVGGIGTLWGPLAGALVYVVLAKAVALRMGGAGKGYDLVIYGAIICVIAALRPYGIVGTIVDALRRRRGATVAPRRGR